MTVAATFPKIEHPSERLTQDLATEVEGALWSYDPLRTSIVDLAVTVEGGRVRLAGIVRGIGQKSMAERLAGRVPGVTEVTSELLTDTDLESAVALALASDESTRLTTDRVTIKSILGAVYLGGTVPGADLAAAESARARAAEIARGVHGVRDVSDQILAVVERTADAPTPETAAASAEQAHGLSPAMAERLQVWRERAKG